MFFQVIHQTKIRRHPYLPPSAGVPRGTNGYCYMWARKGAVAAQFLLPDLRNLVSLPMTIPLSSLETTRTLLLSAPLGPPSVTFIAGIASGRGFTPTSLVSWSGFSFWKTKDESLEVVESTWHWIKWIHLTYNFERFEPKLYIYIHIIIHLHYSNIHTGFGVY